MGVDRVVYITEVAGILRAIHAFQRKSKTGIKTPKADIDLVRARLGRLKRGDGTMNESNFELMEGSGNVFRDFDHLLADLKQAKAILAARIITVLDDRGLAVRKGPRA